MKKSLRLVVSALVLGILSMNLALASEAHAGSVLPTKMSPQNSSVAVYNYTGDTYTITYKFDLNTQQRIIGLGLNPNYDTFYIYSPDNYVNLISIVDNNTGATVEQGGWFRSGSYAIYPGTTTHSIRFIKIR